jgi:hypothetical protein
VAQRGFLRGNEFLRQFAALRRKFRDVREDLAVVANQIQAGDHDRQQDGRKKEIQLALNAIINLFDAGFRLLFALVVLHQQTGNGRVERGLARPALTAFEATLKKEPHRLGATLHTHKDVVELKKASGLRVDQAEENDADIENVEEEEALDAVLERIGPQRVRSNGVRSEVGSGGSKSSSSPISGPPLPTSDLTPLR